jgi:fructose-1,6-bisphosphatase I
VNEEDRRSGKDRRKITTEAVGTTLSKFIADEQTKHPGATGDLSGLLSELITCAKIISREVNKAGLVQILGLTGHRNVQGEQVMKLDMFANETIVKNLSHTGHLCVMASEEDEEPIAVPDEYPKGKYLLCFDPLDGSSNIDANAPIGTIFSVQRCRKDSGGDFEDLLQEGRNQVCGGYFLYGSSTVMVYTTGTGVHMFTLDPSVGEFLLSKANVTIPEQGKYYSVNEGNQKYWEPAVQRYVEFLKSPDEGRKPYSTRYIGSLVADFHRTLCYGGVFAYPADFKDPKKPKGKLRLLYEASPLAMIVEQAGGLASTGRERILDVKPAEIHQRVPLFIGSKTEVRWAEEFIAGGK